MAAAMRPVTVGTVASVDLVSRKQKGYNFLSHHVFTGLYLQTMNITHTHTHTRLTALFPGLPR